MQAVVSFIDNYLFIAKQETIWRDGPQNMFFSISQHTRDAASPAVLLYSK